MKKTNYTTTIVSVTTEYSVDFGRPETSPLVSNIENLHKRYIPEDFDSYPGNKSIPAYLDSKDTFEGPKCCRNCPNNPKNNPYASGFCWCSLPSMENHIS